MKRYLEDLSRDELKSLFDSNEKLRVAIWESAIESVDFWINEKLQGFGRMNDYSIGTYGANYIRVKDISSFLEWVESCNNDFGDFYGMENLIENACVLNDKLRYWDLSDKNYCRVEKRLDEICDILADHFIDYCTREYDWYYKDENLFDFWLDQLWSGVGQWEGYYIDSDRKENAVYIDYTKEIGA